MITCNLMGGLGNQIFQIFTTISYAIQSGHIYNFIASEQLGVGTTTIRNTYWNTFFSQVKDQTTMTFPQMYVIKEEGFVYKEIPKSEFKNPNVLLYGYFQSYKYFQNEYDTICKKIKLKDMKKKVVKSLNLTKEYLDKTISLHFRLGDYKKIHHYHQVITYE